jgi:twitching motility protein PilJ
MAASKKDITSNSARLTAESGQSIARPIAINPMQDFDRSTASRSVFQRLNLRVKILVMTVAISVLPLVGTGIVQLWQTNRWLNPASSNPESATHSSTAETPQSVQQQFLRLYLGAIAVTAIMVGIVVMLWVNYILRSVLQASGSIRKLGHGIVDDRLTVQGTDELAVLSANVNWVAEQMQRRFRQQEADNERHQTLKELILSIPEAETVEAIAQLAVERIQQVLKVDWVAVYRHDDADPSGETVVAEAVRSDWPTSAETDDHRFKSIQRGIERYRQGFNRDGLGSGGTEVQQLASLDIKAGLTIPILIHHQLLGVIVLQQLSSPRIWQQSEIDWLSQIAAQLGLVWNQAEKSKQALVAQQTQSLLEERHERQAAIFSEMKQLLADLGDSMHGMLTVKPTSPNSDQDETEHLLYAIVEAFRQIIAQVKLASLNLEDSVVQNQKIVGQVAVVASEQSQKLTTALEAIQQLTGLMQAIADRTGQAATAAQTTSTALEAGGRSANYLMQNISGFRQIATVTTERVNRLSNASWPAAKIMALANQISSQINLLAINASIVASHVDADEEFADLAAELNELAVCSATATQEIEQFMDNLKQEANEVLRVMELGIVQVNQSSTFAEDTQQNLGQMLQATSDMDQATKLVLENITTQLQKVQHLTDSMQEIATTSDQLSEASQQLARSFDKTSEAVQQLQSLNSDLKIEKQLPEGAPTKPEEA